MRVVTSLGVGAALVAFLATPGVRAEERMNQQGRLTIAAERLFGVAYETSTVEQANTKVTSSQTSVSFLSKAVSAPVTAPRIGVDYFVTDGLSLGVGLGYSTVSLDSEIEGAPAQNQGGSGIHAFIAAPRVGYAYMFNEHFGLWPRAGMTYSWISVDNDAANSTAVSSDSLAVSVEVPLLIMPVSHVAFLLAPTFEYGVAGGGKVKGGMNNMETTIDTNPLDVGLHAGLGVWF